MPGGLIIPILGIISCLYLIYYLPPTSWWRFIAWLLLGLQFALAADIVRSVISPTWNDIGQLATVAVIRTFLNHFLEKDLDEFSAADSVSEGAA